MPGIKKPFRSEERGGGENTERGGREATVGLGTRRSEEKKKKKKKEAAGTPSPTTHDGKCK